MSDGAHLGVGAKRALDTVLGGADQPAEEEQRNPDQMRDWLLACEGPGDYNETARYVGRLVLEAFFADPHLASLPTETEYDWDGDPDRGSSGMKPEYVKALGLYDSLPEDLHERLSGLGLSGFMWGWAVNAARYCVELPPAPNPAILEIG